MPQYFFDIDDGTRSSDDEGIECTGPDVARREALRAAGSMLQDHVQFAEGQTWRMIVRDETGAIITTLSFTAS